jgi:hypothetical protein
MRRPSTLLAILCLAPASAWASPWTLTKSQVVLYLGTDYLFAQREFLDTHSSSRFPLAGRLDGANFSLGARVGLTDRLELEVSLPFRVVSYQADPVVILPQPEGSSASSLDYYQDNVINLSRVAAGVGDFRFIGRVRLLSGAVAAALELGVKAPSGYRGPSGTFGDRPASQAAFVADVARYVTPENVTDDVTLGDAQLDLSPRLLLGYALSTGTFFRGAVGYDLRLGGAGDQLFAELKAGQVLHPRVLVYAGASLVYALQEGRVIGVSVAAVDPELPARAYGGLENLALREVTLDRDALELSGGLIVRLTDTLEINLGYQRTVWGRNTSAVDVVSSSVAFRTALAE